MKLIKEGIAKEIPAHLVAEYKAKGWHELATKQPAKEPDKEPEQKQEKPKRSKKEA